MLFQLSQYFFDAKDKETSILTIQNRKYLYLLQRKIYLIS